MFKKIVIFFLGQQKNILFVELCKISKLRNIHYLYIINIKAINHMHVFVYSNKMSLQRDQQIFVISNERVL